MPQLPTDQQHGHDILENLPPRREWAEWLADVGDRGTDEIMRWKDYARQALQRANGVATAVATKSYLDWVDEQARPANHGAALFKITKSPSVCLPSSIRSKWFPHVVTEPLEIAMHKRMEWTGIWNSADALANIPCLITRMSDLRELAILEKATPPTLAQVDEALTTFKTHTGKGLDNVGPNFYSSLPIEGRQQLTDVLVQCHRALAWPWQVLNNLCKLLPKASGGDRVIGLMNFFARLYSRTQRPQTRRWAAARGRAWDHAMAGSSSLRSAILSQLQLDFCEANSEQWAAVFYDFTKFFDSISLAALVKETLRLKFSPTVTYMALLQYLAPRVLKIGACYTEWIHPCGGVLAGDGEACNMAKCALYNIVEQIEKTACGPWHALSCFVDDTKQIDSDRDSAILVKKIVIRGQAFAKLAKRAGFIFSAKSVVVSPDRAVARNVARAMAAVGVTLKVANHVSDLGIDLSAGKWRRVDKQKKRIALARDRNARVKKLVKRRARMLVHLGAVGPQATHGHEVSGMAPSVIRKIRGQLATHVGHKPGRCTTTLLSLEQPGKDPAALIPTRAISNFIGFCSREQQMLDIVQQVWAHRCMQLNAIQDAQLWRAAKGYVASIICTLKSVGWKPISATRWMDPDGLEWGAASDTCGRTALRDALLQLGHEANVGSCVAASARWRPLSRSRPFCSQEVHCKASCKRLAS